MQPIPPFDPLQKKSRVQHAMEQAVATPAGTWFFKRVVSHIEPAMIRMSNGKLQFGSGPRVNLTVPGRKSGEPRTTTLLYFTRGDDVVLMASNFGGTGHPAWYLNLKAAGEGELAWRGGHGKYTARETEEPERSELYELAVKLYEGYDIYADKTAGVRTIPVMVLTPASA